MAFFGVDAKKVGPPPWRTQKKSLFFYCPKKAKKSHFGRRQLSGGGADLAATAEKNYWTVRFQSGRTTTAACPW
jgi:hypothetical protein